MENSMVVIKFRRLLCYIGLHTWLATLDQYRNEFGGIPLSGRVASTAKCEYCGKSYKED